MGLPKTPESSLKHTFWFFLRFLINLPRILKDVLRILKLCGWFRNSYPQDAFQIVWGSLSLPLDLAYPFHLTTEVAQDSPWICSKLPKASKDARISNGCAMDSLWLFPKFCKDSQRFRLELWRKLPTCLCLMLLKLSLTIWFRILEDSLRIMWAGLHMIQVP